jgi:hypothetical protein
MLFPTAPPDAMSPKYVDWLLVLDRFVRNPEQFALGRQDCDLRDDYDVFGNATTFVTAQFHMQTAVWQLIAAHEMQTAGSPPSAVPALTRAALEAASVAAWFLAPVEVNIRIERVVRFSLQDSYDQHRFEGPRDDDQYRVRRGELHAVGERVGLSGGYLKDHRFNVSGVILDLQNTVGEDDLVALWSLLSGLAHSRPWAIVAASGVGAQRTGVVQMFVPREAFGYYQLRTAEVLDAAIDFWNRRVGAIGTSNEVPRLPRTEAGRALGLPSPPWTWSPA